MLSRSSLSVAALLALVSLAGVDAYFYYPRIPEIRADGIEYIIFAAHWAFELFSNCAASPALPSGMYFNHMTCDIIGSPSVVVSPPVTHRITGYKQAGGHTESEVRIGVMPVEPLQLHYSGGTSEKYIAGRGISTNYPRVYYNPHRACGERLEFCVINKRVECHFSWWRERCTERIEEECDLTPPSRCVFTITEWSVSPALPAGLSHNTGNGEVTGTPSGAHGATDHVFTAKNQAGTVTYTQRIEVISAAPTGLSYDGSRTPGTWVMTQGIRYFERASIDSSSAVHYRISPALPRGLTISATNGAIYGTPEQLVLETARYTVTATNSGGSETATISLRVHAAAPRLSYNHPITLIRLSDRLVAPAINRAGDNAAVTSCSISPALPAGLYFNTYSCEIEGVPRVERWPAQTHTVTGRNSGGSSTTTVSIGVKAIAPTIFFYSGGARQVYYTGMAIHTDEALIDEWSDRITINTVTPSLPAGLHFNSEYGIVTGTPTEARSATEYTFTAGNSGGSLTYKQTIEVISSAPTGLSYDGVTGSHSWTFTAGRKMKETASLNHDINTSPVTYTVTPALPRGMFLTPSTGLISGTPTTLATAQAHTITATNSGGSQHITATITVIAEAPTVRYAKSSFTFTHQSWGAFERVKAGGPYAAVTSCSVSPTLPRGLSINGATCEIYGRPTVISWPGANYTVTGRNTGGESSTIVEIVIKAIAPTEFFYSGGKSQVYYVSKAIESDYALIDDWSDPITVNHVSPALPAGLSFNAQYGIVTGTPTEESAVTTYTFSAGNSGGSLRFTQTIKVLAAPPAGLKYDGGEHNFNLTLGQHAHETASLNSGSQGGANVVYSVSPALPANMTLDTTTGRIAGSPTVLGINQRKFTVTATNDAGSTSAELNIRVQAICPKIGFQSEPYVLIRSQTNLNVKVTNYNGERAAVTKCNISPALPAGLKFNAGTCDVTGVATETSWPAKTYSVTAFNSCGAGTSSTAMLKLGVKAIAPSSVHWSGGAKDVLILQEAMTTSYASHTGDPITHWSVSPSLPAGLSMNSLGSVSGKPTALQSAANYTFTASNSGGSASFVQAISVIAAKPTGLGYDGTVGSIAWTWTQGHAYTEVATIANSISAASVVYSIFPTAMPGGMSFNNATGVISGTVTELMTSARNYKVTAKNTDGQITITVTIRVVAQKPEFHFSPGSAVVTHWDTIDAISSSGCKQMYSVNGLVAEAHTGFGFSSFGSSTNTTHATSCGNPYAAIVSCTVAPALPKGLHVNQATCSIEGRAETISWPPHKYKITGCNSGGCGEAGISLGVKAIAPTLLIYSGGMKQVYSVSSAITTDEALIDSWSDPITYNSVTPSLPAGLSFNSEYGIVTGTPTTVTAAQSYMFTAANSGGSITFNQTIEVIAVAPADLTYNMGHQTLVLTRGHQFKKVPNINGGATSGGANLVYTVTPALPTNVTVDMSTGLLSGTPTELSTARTYRITATNSGGSSTFDMTISVIAVCPTLKYDQTYTLTRARDTLTANVTNTAGHYAAVTSCRITPALPKGLALNLATCEVSGTPMNVSWPTKKYTVTGSNTCGSSTTTVEIGVKAIAPTRLHMSGGSVDVHTVDTTIVPGVPTVHGDPITSWKVEPALPAGLAFNSSSGHVTGRPTSVTTPTEHTFTVSNTGGSTSFTQMLSVNAEAPTNLAYDGTEGTVTWTLTAGHTLHEAPTISSSATTGGATVTYSINPSNLPKGLTFNTATGVIDGVPTELVLSQRTFTVSASNSGGVTTISLKIRVVAVEPSISFHPVQHTYTHKECIKTVEVENNSGPYGAVTSCTISGSLPKGLIFNGATCAIHGCAQQISWPPQTYLITATNSGGSSLATVSVGVKAIAPADIQYSGGSKEVYTVGESITPDDASTHNSGKVFFDKAMGSHYRTVGFESNPSIRIPQTCTADDHIYVTVTGCGGDTLHKTTCKISLRNRELRGFLKDGSANYWVPVESELVEGSYRGHAGCDYLWTGDPGVDSYPGFILAGYDGWLHGNPQVATFAQSYSGDSSWDYCNSIAGLNGQQKVEMRYVCDSPHDPITKYAVTPALPAGLTLNTRNGTISGTPTTVTGATEHKITASNSGGAVAYYQEITVNAVAPADLTYNGGDQHMTFTLGHKVTKKPSLNKASMAGGATLVFSINTALPAGLSFDTSTGVISGTPSALSTTSRSHTVTVSNSGGSTTFTLLVRVIAVCPVVKYERASHMHRMIRSSSVGNVAGKLTNTAGPKAALTSCKISSPLPRGMIFNEVTCDITGAPTEVSWPVKKYFVRASNSCGSSATAVHIGVVAVAPTNLHYTGGESDVVTVSKAMNVSVPKWLHDPITHWSVSPALPAGMTLSSTTGEVSGTPTHVTNETIHTFTASNTGGSTSFEQNITVIAEAPADLAYDGKMKHVYWKFTLGHEYSEVPTVSSSSTSGGATLTYSHTGTLPEGMYFNTATGAIAGTPTVLQTTEQTHTVTATSTGGSTSITVHIVVIAVAPTVNYHSRGYVFVHKTPIAPTIEGTSCTTHTDSSFSDSGLVAESFDTGSTSSFGSSSSFSSFSTSDTFGTVTTCANPYAAITSCTVSPALPSGMTLNGATCAIGGVPEVISWPAQSYTITASNSGGSDSAAVYIGVQAIAPTELIYTGGEAQVFTVGSAIPADIALIDIFSDPIVINSVTPALPAGVYLNINDGIVTGTPAQVTPKKTYTFTASNTGGAVSFTQDITVNAVAPAHLSYDGGHSLMTLYLGQSVNKHPSLNAASMTGGANIHFAVTPALPANVTLDTATGYISGTPTEQMTTAKAYTFRATNSGGSSTFVLNIKVLPVCPRVTYETAVHTLIRATDTMASTITNLAGPNAPLSHCAITPALPKGLTLNKKTCEIAGRPTVVSWPEQTYTVRAANACGSAKTSTKIGVKAIAPTSVHWSGGATEALTVDRVMASSVPTVNGDPITGWSVFPSLPAGLNMSATNGTISGTPTHVQHAIEYTLSASNTGGSVSFKQTIKIDAQAPSDLAFDGHTGYVSWTWTAGHKYEETPSISGASSLGGATVTYSISPTTMIAGTYFNTATGVISGTPTKLNTAGTNYTVTATNSGGSTTINVFVRCIAVAPSIQYNPASLTLIHNTCMETAVDVDNSAGPFAATTHCTSSPRLPRGLVFNGATCAISGCPRAISWPPQTYVVTASNSGGSSTASFTLGVKAIAPTELIYSGGASVVFTVGTAIHLDEALIDVESDPIVVNTVTPALPAGLSFNSEYGLVTGTPTEVTPKKVYTFLASNSGGAQQYSQEITVNAVAPADLTYNGGHAQVTFTLGHNVTKKPSLNKASMAGGATLVFSINTALPAGLSLDTSTGVISGKPSALSTTYRSYTVTATNSGGSTTFTLSLRVIAVCPVVKYEQSDYILTRTVDSVSSPITNLAGRNAAITRCELLTPERTGLPHGLHFNGATCEITGTPSVDSWPQKKYFIVASNSCGESMTTIKVGVKAIAPTSAHWSGGSAEVLTVNNKTTPQTVKIVGDPITSWQVSPGLPSGLVLSLTNGSISGTPTEVQTVREYTLTAANTGGSISFQQNITVHAAAPADLAYDGRTNNVSWTWTQGNMYAEVPTLAAASLAGGAQFTFSIAPATLIDGLYFNSATGKLSGEPKVLGQYNYTITASDTGGSTSIAASLNIIARPPILSYPATKNTYIHKSCIKPLDASNAAGPYGAITHCTAHPTLPRGLTLNGATCAVEGCPEEISWPFRRYDVTASNTGGTSTASVTLGVKAIAPTFMIYTGGESEVFTVGTAIATDEALIDVDSDPIIVNVVYPALPAGLSFNSQYGIVTGTPTEVTPKKLYTFDAANSGGAVQFKQYITVNAAAPADLTYNGGNEELTLTLGSQVTEHPSLNAASMAGGAVLTFTVDSDLPTGLSLDSKTGVISGRPMTLKPTSTNYTVSVSNSGGSTSVTLVVRVIAVCPDVTYTSDHFTLTRVHEPMKAAVLNKAGRFAAVTKCVVSPELPDGLALNTATCEITGVGQVISWPVKKYVVTASNSCGSHAAFIKIGVKAIAPLNVHWSGGAKEQLTVLQEMPSSDPSVTGGDPITSWTITPPLPLGLTMNPANGTVSGRPVHVQIVPTVHTLIASNTGGSVSFTQTLSIIAQAPSGLKYDGKAGTVVWTWTLGHYYGERASLSATSYDGDATVAFEISPSFSTSSGMGFDSNTGLISGTPVELEHHAQNKTYTVTASNSGGSTSITLIIRTIAERPYIRFSPSYFAFTHNQYITEVETTSCPPSHSTSYGFSVSSGGFSSFDSFGSSSVTSYGSSDSIANPEKSSSSCSSGTCLHTSSLCANVYAAITLCTAYPPLPLGLTLNGATCAINGRPEVVSWPPTMYSITASNTGGTVSTTITIGVKAIAPVELVYTGGASAVYTAGSAIRIDEALIDVESDPIVINTVIPALPAGLHFNAEYGIVSGTPTQVTPMKTYQFVASNSGGAATYYQNITVNAVAPSDLTYDGGAANMTFTLGQALSETPSINRASMSDGATLTYSTTALPAGLSLNTSTGVFSGTPTQLMPAGKSYTITVTNSGGSTSVTLLIKVIAVAPEVHYSQPSIVLTRLYDTLSQAITNTAGNNAAVTTCSVADLDGNGLPTGLALNGQTCELEGTPTEISYPPATYKVVACNSGGCSNTTVSVGVKAIPPTILHWTGGKHEVLIQGKASNVSTPTHNGDPITSWSVTPHLPSGLVMNPETGDVTGTPEEVHVTPREYSLMAANTGGSMMFKQNITVLAQAPTGFGYDGNVGNVGWTWTLGHTYREEAHLSGGNTNGAQVTYSVSPALPKGVALNATTGSIYGTPTILAVANRSYTVTATNSGGSDSIIANISVIAVRPSLSFDPSRYTFIHNQPLNNTVVVYDDAGPYAAIASCVSDPELPDGLALNEATCEITGSSTVVSWPPSSYTITATNSGGSRSAIVTIGVKAIAPTELVYSAGAAAVLTVDTATHGEHGEIDKASDPIVVYTVTPDLPAGLSIDMTSSKLTGTPTEVHAAKVYTFTASNSGGAISFKQNITIAAEAPSGLTYETDAMTWTIGHVIEEVPSINANSMAGGAELIYSIDAPLPDGVEMHTNNGSLYGTPTTLLTSAVNYTVTATNSGGSTSTTFALRVIAVCPRIQYPASPYVSRRLSTTETMNATATNLMGTLGAVTSCSVSPPLPDGLTVHNTSCHITGVATVYKSMANYRVTAANSCGNDTVSVALMVKAIAPSAYSLSGGANHSYHVDEWSSLQNYTVSGDPVTAWAVTPALPAGLVLHSNGTVSGYPTAMQAGRNHTFVASNSGGSAQFIQNIKIIAQAPSGLGYDGVTGTCTWTWTAGHHYIEEPTLKTGTADGATVTYALTTGTLPSGVSINTATGVISGSPTELVLTERQLTVKATTSGGSTTVAIRLKVNAVKPKVKYVPSTLTDFVHNKSVTLPVAIDDTAGLYSNITSCSVQPTLPAGMNISATCHIGGTPASISWPAQHYIVTACNSGGCGSTAIVLGVRAIKPTFCSMTEGNKQDYILDSPIPSNFVMVDDSSDPIMGASIVPRLPTGLYFNRTDGTIYGTPTEHIHTKHYKVTVSNSGGSCTHRQKMKVTHNPPHPWRYEASAGMRSALTCSVLKDDAMAVEIVRLNGVLGTCNTAKATALSTYTSLSYQYDTLSADWLAKSAALNKSLAESSTLSDQITVATHTLHSTMSNLTLQTARYSINIAKLKKQIASESLASNLAITTQPNPTYDVDGSTHIAVAVKDSTGITIGTLSGFVHVTVPTCASCEMLAFPIVNGVAQVNYPVRKKGTHQLMITSEGVTTSVSSSNEMCTPTQSTVTNWQGSYVQFGSAHNMVFNLVFTNNRTITGQGSDTVGPFMWSGSFSGTEVSLTKQYQGSYAVQYQGSIQKDSTGVVSLTGTWSLGGTGSGTFTMVEQTSVLTGLVGSCALSVLSNTFVVGEGAPQVVVITNDAPLTVDSSDPFSVSVQLHDRDGNPLASNTSAFLTVAGGSANALEAANTTADFLTRNATFTGIKVMAGKDLRLVISTADGTFNVTRAFKSTVVPASFTHTISGMSEEDWNSAGVQDSFKTTVANTMGSYVSFDDVTITSYTVLTRRTGTGVAVNHNVALTHAGSAKQSVANLENSANNGDFDNNWKSNAANAGATLPANLASAGLSGTSSAGMALPSKYDNQVAAHNAAQAANSNSSSSSSAAKHWEIVAIVFIGLFGMAVMGVAVAMFMQRKGPDAADMDHASSIGGDVKTPTIHSDKPTVDTFDAPSSLHDDALAVQDVHFTEGRDRADSSQTVRIGMNPALSENCGAI